MIRHLMMGVAKATFYAGWEKKMGELRNINPEALVSCHS